MSVNRELDLRGEVCPYTLVKTVLVLETMAPDEVLQVAMDYAPSVKEVPVSVSNRGHEVLKVCHVDATEWIITVRKRSDE